MNSSQGNPAAALPGRLATSPLKAAEVTQPGAYEWINAAGKRHIGFLRAAARGSLTGSFISVDGASVALSLRYGNGDACEGVFYGPLPPAAETVQEPFDKVVAFGLARPWSYSLPGEARLEEAPQTSGESLWAVRRRGACLNKDGEWEFEPMPSSRGEAFLQNCRWPTREDAYSFWARTVHSKQPA